MIRVRKAQRSDRPALRRLIRATDVFNPGEKAVARELVDAALGARGEHPDYKILVAADRGAAPVGYICFGPSPMTVGTWDVYWVIVDPGRRRAGAGRSLVRAALDLIRARKGRRLLVDTSTQAAYRPAQALYVSLGFRPVATVPDYYRKGWHRVTYCKSLP